MRTTHPNDEIGALMMLMLPQWIVHRVDPWSPLWPFPVSKEEDPTNSFEFPSALQRTMDQEVLARSYSQSKYRQREPTQLDLANFMQHSNIEVICVLEGTDASTGNAVQVSRICLPATFTQQGSP